MENYTQISQLERQYLSLKEDRDNKLAEIEYKDKKISIFGGFKDMKNLAKKMMGNTSLSRKAAMEFDKVAAAYRPQLEQLRMQAEALL